LILVTGHRRENFGTGFENICWALRDVVEAFPDVLVVYPVHLNPNVQRPVKEILAPVTNDAGPQGRLALLSPLEYAPFVYLLSQSYLVLTDSGGIQEETPALGKPVLVMRDVTERPEGVWAKTVKLVGTDRGKIFQEIKELLENPVSYQAMAQARNPYGDGRAANRIVHILANRFSEPLPLDFPCPPELKAPEIQRWSIGSGWQSSPSFLGSRAARRQTFNRNCSVKHGHALLCEPEGWRVFLSHCAVAGGWVSIPTS
jgi:hypothetical protein